MKRFFLYFSISLLLMVSCKTVPITGRRGLKLVSSTEINAMSFQQYNEVISTSQLSKNQGQTAQVKKVGKNIQAAVEKYLSDNGYSELLNGYQWEFNFYSS